MNQLKTAQQAGILLELLIVDDDVAVCDKLEKHFNALGYAVHCAYDGETALSWLREHPVDVMLCDLHMPGISGVQLVEKLSELDASFPVIMMSRRASRDELASFLRLPVYDFFEKPIENTDVLENSINSAFAEFQLNNDQHQLQFLNKKLEKSLSHLQVDLQAGRYVQRKMLPDTPRRFGEYEFSHCLLPSSYLSGDFVEYVLVGKQYVCFFIADVSGHGASSAFITVLLKNITARMRSAWIHKEDTRITSPSKFLASVNEEFIALESGKHATMFAGVLDMANHRLCYSMAGHHPLPIIKCEQGASYIKASGRPIGLFPEYSVKEHTLELPEECSLILFSDGILEILKPKTIEEKERLLLDKVAAKKIDSVVELSDTMGVNDLDEYPDDVAILLLQRKPLDNG